MEPKLDWQQIKREIYYQDGSLRDIYVLGTTIDDWRKWVDFVNENYTVSFSLEDSQTKFNKILSTTIQDRFAGNYEVSCQASIHIGKMIINTFFFSEEEIENDITPAEFTTPENHEDLVNYMQALASLLNKTVRLTEENHRERVLFEILPDRL